MPDTEPTVLKTQDICRRFDVSRYTVARWVRDGKLAAFRTPGGELRFRPEDVEAFEVSAA